MKKICHKFYQYLMAKVVVSLALYRGQVSFFKACGPRVRQSLSDIQGASLTRALIRRARERHRQPASTNYDKYDCIHICERHSYHNLSCEIIKSKRRNERHRLRDCYCRLLLLALTLEQAQLGRLLTQFNKRANSKLGKSFRNFLYRRRRVLAHICLAFIVVKMDVVPGAVLALQILAVFSIAVALIAYLMRQSRNASDEYDIRSKRHVLVTSCDTCVGLQLALALSEAGHKVFAGLLEPCGQSAAVKILRAVEQERLKARDPENLEDSASASGDLRSPGQIVPLKLDSTREDSLRACLDAIRAKLPAGEDGLWAVVHTSGLALPGVIERQESSAWESMLRQNIIAPLRTARAFIPLLRTKREKRSHGHHKAHSFQHFHGPVHGHHEKVEWWDKHGHEHHDYVAHPKYKFAYGVMDHHTHDFHGQKEHRDVYSKHAHSFAHFHGPVEGHHHEITIPDKHGHHHTVDYVAHPKYKFAYGVEDHHTGDFHGQKEHRDVAVTTTRAVLMAATEPTSSTTMVITGTIKPLDSSKQISHYLHIPSSKLSHFYHRRLALDALDRTNSKYFIALPESALKLMGMFCLYDLPMKNELRRNCCKYK
ncbi:unnamed protein product [Trichogramma brassicae]|uniref:Uncharacterized protein n=1 Tax=Trichogramma brassicae TaxID=86971 RepID=A0A6H5HVR2_9HYME|nr:unnamed protein product [Trichogramma brassicae]